MACAIVHSAPRIYSVEELEELFGSPGRWPQQLHLNCAAHDRDYGLPDRYSAGFRRRIVKSQEEVKAELAQDCVPLLDGLFVCGGRSLADDLCGLACGMFADYLCDFPTPNRKRVKTCSMPLCSTHRVEQGDGLDYCPQHDLAMRQAAQEASNVERKAAISNSPKQQVCASRMQAVGTRAGAAFLPVLDEPLPGPAIQ